MKHLMITCSSRAGWESQVTCDKCFRSMVTYLIESGSAAASIVAGNPLASGGRVVSDSAVTAKVAVEDDGVSATGVALSDGCEVADCDPWASAVSGSTHEGTDLKSEIC